MANFPRQLLGRFGRQKLPAKPPMSELVTSRPWTPCGLQSLVANFTEGTPTRRSRSQLSTNHSMQLHRPHHQAAAESALLQPPYATSHRRTSPLPTAPNTTTPASPTPTATTCMHNDLRAVRPRRFWHASSRVLPAELAPAAAVLLWLWSETSSSQLYDCSLDIRPCSNKTKQSSMQW